MYENASHTRWTISQAVSDRVLKERDINDREEIDRCLCLELYLMQAVALASFCAFGSKIPPFHAEAGACLSKMMERDGLPSALVS